MANIRLLGPAKSQIVAKLREGGRTAKEVASHLGIQTSAARKHLERLTEMGIAREEFVRSPRGRPKKHYTLTEEGRELFPRSYDAVLNTLLTTIVADRGPDDARRLLTKVAETLAEGLPPTPRRPAPTRVAALLNDLGFEASAERKGRSVLFTSRNCPLLRTATAHRELVCVGLHAEIIRRTTGGKRVKRDRWIVTGDSVCTHTIDG